MVPDPWQFVSRKSAKKPDRHYFCTWQSERSSFATATPDYVKFQLKARSGPPTVVSSFPVENFQISPFQPGGTVTLGCAHDKKQTRGVFSVSQKRQYRRIPRSQKPTGTERKFVFSRSYRRYVYGWRRPEICRYLSVGGFFDLAALKRNIFLRLLLLFFFSIVTGLHFLNPTTTVHCHNMWYHSVIFLKCTSVSR